MQDFFKKAVRHYAAVNPSPVSGSLGTTTSDDLQQALLKVLGQKVKPQLDEFDMEVEMHRLKLDVSF